MLDPHQERNDDGHKHGGGLGGPLQRKTGGEGCEDGDSRGRGHPPVSSSGHQRQPRRPRDEGRSTEAGTARNAEGSS